MCRTLHGDESHAANCRHVNSQRNSEDPWKYFSPFLSHSSASDLLPLLLKGLREVFVQHGKNRCWWFDDWRSNDCVLVGVCQSGCSWGWISMLSHRLMGAMSREAPTDQRTEIQRRDDAHKENYQWDATFTGNPRVDPHHGTPVDLSNELTWGSTLTQCIWAESDSNPMRRQSWKWNQQLSVICVVSPKAKSL